MTAAVLSEDLRSIPKTFDGGDVDEGRWYGSDVCCLTCRETAPMRMSVTRIYLLAELCCGECGETFCEVDEL